VAKYIIEGGISKQSVTTIDEKFIPKTIELALEKLGVELIDGLKESFTEEYKKTYPGRTSSLSFIQGIDAQDVKIDVNEGNASLTFKMDQVGKFIDKGVRGKKNINAPSSSPFQFRKKHLPNTVREDIVLSAKKSGLNLEQRKSLSYAIEQKIFRDGLRAIPFFTNYIDNEFKAMAKKEVERVLGKNITNFIIGIEAK
jgi:hypothetical protein